MYYLRARYYHPDAGRFWTMDKYTGNQSDPLSLHKYLYCRNDPANAVDPSGNESLLSVQASVQILSYVGSQYLHASSAALNHIRTRYDTKNSFAELSYGVDIMCAAVDAVQDTSAILGIAQGASYFLTRGAPYVAKILKAAMRESFPNWTFIHNTYLKWVRPGAVEHSIRTPWGSLRKLDDFDALTKTGFEAKVTNWESMPQVEFQRVMGQIADDRSILVGQGEVDRIIWFGAHPLPDSGLGGQIKEALKQAHIEYWQVPMPE
jgi:hypothetical protein